MFVLAAAPPAQADDHTEKSAETLIADAERAMSDGDFIGGVRAYADAAATTDSVETARQATLTAYEFGFDNEAAQAAQAWAALAADPLRANAFHGFARLRAGDTDAAIDILSPLFTDATAATLCEMSDNELGGFTRFEDMQRVFATLSKKHRDIGCVARLAASAAVSLNDYDAAEDHFRHLQKIDAFDNEVRLLKMASLIRQDNSDEAFTDPALRLSRDASTADRIALAFLNAQAEQTQNALNMLELLRIEAPDDPDVTEAFALVQIEVDNFDLARSLMFELLASGDKTSTALFHLARLFERDGRSDQALRMYSQVDSGEYVLQAQNRAAQIVARGQGNEAAIDLIQQFAQRHPRYGLSLLTIEASLHSDNDDHERAIALFDQFLSIKPNAEFAVLGKAGALLDADQLDASIAEFRRAVEMFPNSATSLNALGYTLADHTRKFREAERLIDKALEIEPDNAAIIDSKGWVLFKRGKYAEAREHLERAYALFPDPEVAAHLGETLWKLGEEQAARELLQEAWRRNPTDEHLRETMQRLIEDGPATRS